MSLELSRLRNLGVVAHIDAGKTTVSERMLFFAGVEHRIGEVDEGTTVLDWMAEERERGITITAAATTLPWKDHAINLIDTPGHVDFTVEVERCMRVLDGAVLVIDAVAGVQAQSETVWRQMRRYGVAAVAFVNKCDRAGADFLAALASIRQRLRAPAVAVQYPILQAAGGVVGAVDLIGGRALLFEPGANDPPREEDPPPGLADEVGVLRAELIEAVAQEDEGLFQTVAAGREPDPAALRAALRRCTVAGTLVPVLCGAALRNVGVHPLLDAVVDYLPSPADVPPVQALVPDGEPDERVEVRPDPDGPPCALAFKLMADEHADLTFVRVYRGRIEPGLQLWNPRLRRAERVARVLRMHAEARQALDTAGPGEIVALTGLKQTGTGDTLCARREPVLLQPLAFPEPVIRMVVEPSSTADRDKLRQALGRLEREDPSFHVQEDADTGQWLIAGMGELHLEVVQHRLQTDFHVRADMGAPRVAYREAVLAPGSGAGHVERTLGNKEVFGAVDVELVPVEGALSVEVEWPPGPPCVPAAFRGAVQEALLLGAQSGPLFGFPLVGARVRVVGGRSSPGKDAEVAFAQAAGAALRQAMQAARIALLEPVMAFEIEAPAEFASGILADLNGRRAEVGGMEAQGDLRRVSGRVPLASMFGYSTAVRSLSQGRASFSMEPAGFQVVPEEELQARGMVWT